jgi:hypothetical protein
MTDGRILQSNSMLSSVSLSRSSSSTRSREDIPTPDAQHAYHRHPTRHKCASKPHNCASNLPRLPLLHPLLLRLHHIHPLIRIRQPLLLLNRTSNFPILALRSLHIRALQRQTRNHNRHSQPLRVDSRLHQFLRRVHRAAAHQRESRSHASHPRAEDNAVPVLVCPAHRALAARCVRVEFLQQRLARAVVVAVRVLGGFVGSPGAVCADDGGERACGYCEEDFEGEGEVAD